MKPLLSTPIPIDSQEVVDEIYLDIETLRLSHEVQGGWSNIKAFGIAVAVTWDATNQYRAWLEPAASELIAELGKFHRIVTFNGEGFDFHVLSAYGEVKSLLDNSFDVLAHIHRQIGFRVKLDHLAEQTLGVRKSGDGLQSVEWWRQGEKDKVIEYCVHDVEILLRLVAHGRQNGYVMIDRGRIPVSWSPLRVPLTKSAAAGR